MTQAENQPQGTNKGGAPRVSRSAQRQSRASSFFAVYYQLGAERSLDSLRANLATFGVRIGRSTLENYSVEFHWQQRCLELDARVKADEDTRLVNEREDMNNRHALAARNFQALALAGVQAKLEAVRSGKPVPMDAKSASEVYERSMKMERLVRGEPTDRTEAIITVWNVMVAQIAFIFKEVNRLPDPREREREFAARVDGYREKHMAEGGLIEAK